MALSKCHCRRYAWCHFRDELLEAIDGAARAAHRASFELMDQLGLESAFTFDTDFRDCGYRMLP